MRQALFFILFAGIIACNTSADKDAKGEKTASAKTFTWTQEDDNTFLSSCVDSARKQVTEAQAYARCKCVLEKLKEKFPSLDSASTELMDIEKAKQYTEKCMDVKE